jgi:hypothetical protein
MKAIEQKIAKFSLLIKDMIKYQNDENEIIV